MTGEAFDDFKLLILEVVTTLEKKRADARPKNLPAAKGADNVIEPMRLDNLRSAATDRNDPELTGLVDQAELEMESRTAKVREVLARYQRLATLGQLVDKMIHEVGQPAAACRAAAVAGIERIEDSLHGRVKQSYEDSLHTLEEEFQIVRTQSRAALDILKRLAPFGGRRRGRPHDIKLEQAVADAVDLLRSDVARTRASISLPTSSTFVTVDGTELQEIVINLVTNSLYWITRGPRGSARQISIDVERNLDGSLSLIVSDSGPGVPDEDRDQIFEPYFSTREGGFGLGLALVGEIVSEYYGGELELVTPGALGGATFRATLRRRGG